MRDAGERKEKGRMKRLQRFAAVKKGFHFFSTRTCSHIYAATFKMISERAFIFIEFE